MPYNQLLGMQGCSVFRVIHAYDGSPVDGWIPVYIHHTSPTITFHPLYPPAENWRGQSFDMGGGYTIKMDLDIYNIQEEYTNILALAECINLIRTVPFTYQLKIRPWFSSALIRKVDGVDTDFNFSFLGVLNGDISIDQVKKLLNTAQKITLSFTSEDIRPKFLEYDIDFLNPSGHSDDPSEMLENGEYWSTGREHEDIGDSRTPEEIPECPYNKQE